MELQLSEIGQLEYNLNKLQRKFNLLSSWLQLKFHDDLSFPQSILLNSINENLEIKNEFTELPPVQVSPRNELLKIVDIESILQTAEAPQIQLPRHKTTPCFVNVQRLEHDVEKTCSTEFQEYENSATSAEYLYQDTSVSPEWELQHLDQEPTLDSLNSEESVECDPLLCKLKVIRPIRVNDLSKVSKSPTYSCPICKKLYTRRSIYYHVRTVHKDEVTNEIIAAISQSIRESNLKHACPACSERFSHFKYWKSHIMKCHPELYAEKETKGEFNADNMELDDIGHKKISDPKKCITCPFCDKTHTRRLIYNHLLSEHKEKTATDAFQCIKNSHKQQFKRSKRPLRYTCPVCKHFFRMSPSLRSHLKTYHQKDWNEDLWGTKEFLESCIERKPYDESETISCLECQEEMPLFELTQHKIRAHGQEERFSCSFCAFETNKKSQLLSHLRIHADHKKFKCKLCSFRAKQHQGIQAHMRRTHDASKYATQCSLCGDIFKSIEILKKHIQKVHENYRAFPCTLCEKAFKDKTHLKYHLKTHENPNGRKRGLNKEREPKRRKDKRSNSDVNSPTLESATSCSVSGSRE